MCSADLEMTVDHFKAVNKWSKVSVILLRCSISCHLMIKLIKYRNKTDCVAGASRQHQILLRGHGGIWIWGPRWAGLLSKRHLLERCGLCLHLWQLLAGKNQTLYHLWSERNLLLFHWGGFCLVKLKEQNRSSPSVLLWFNIMQMCFKAHIKMVVYSWI